MNSARGERTRFTLPLGLVIILLMASAYGFPDWKWVLIPLIALLLGLVLYIRYFFRDPERTVPADEEIIVAPADGLVVGIEEIDDTIFQLGPTRRIAIFLSVFDVHINRAPCEGTVLETKYQKGEFLDVRHPECSQRNEYLAWKIGTPHGIIQVRQIAGLIARRIVAWKQTGEGMQRGERFGLIRFGSRTELYLPLSCEILVQVGDRVQGASSAVARWKT